jgi:hypothetical protein
MTEAMDASQIRALRAVIAASCDDEASGTRRGVIARLFAPKDAARRANAPPEPSRKAAPFLEKNEEAAASASDIGADALEEPLAQTLHILGLGPRRAAFGQRREQVVALVDVGPAPSCVLRLTPPEGAALDHNGGGAADDHLATAARHPFQAAAGEAPFFPEDLEDSPRRGPKNPTPADEVQPPVDRSSDMASTFLLASLAARLAQEAAVLNARLADL